MAESLAERAGADLTHPEQFFREVVLPCRPLVIRGLVSRWPATQAGTRSAPALQEHLSAFDTRGAPVEAFFGAGGKYFYDASLSGFNFERRRMRFSDALQAIVEDTQSVYVGSVPTHDFLPGFAACNPMPLLPASAAPRVWIGNAANVSSHYDALDNLACVIAGARRFTLFSPELIGSLYVGPVDHTMAGQPVSLAAAADPDDARYPLFQQIKDKALIAELLPGDALYLPKLWWHQVESTQPFNALVNYWWDAFAVGPDAPYTAMLLSMISIAERPAEERRAWRALFDHYVFRRNGHPLAHLPPERHGLLGPLKPDNYGKIRARIMHLLRGG